MWIARMKDRGIERNPIFLSSIFLSAFLGPLRLGCAGFFVLFVLFVVGQLLLLGLTTENRERKEKQAVGQAGAITWWTHTISR